MVSSPLQERSTPPQFTAARLETARLFAFLFVVSLLAYLLYSLIAYTERKVVFWSATTRMQRLQ